MRSPVENSTRMLCVVCSMQYEVCVCSMCMATIRNGRMRSCAFECDRTRSLNTLHRMLFL